MSQNVLHSVRQPSNRFSSTFGSFTLGALLDSSLASSPGNGGEVDRSVLGMTLLSDLVLAGVSSVTRFGRRARLLPQLLGCVGCCNSQPVVERVAG